MWIGTQRSASRKLANLCGSEPPFSPETPKPPFRCVRHPARNRQNRQNRHFRQNGPKYVTLSQFETRHFRQNLAATFARTGPSTPPKPPEPPKPPFSAESPLRFLVGPLVRGRTGGGPAGAQRVGGPGHLQGQRCARQAAGAAGWRALRPGRGLGVRHLGVEDDMQLVADELGPETGEELRLLQEATARGEAREQRL